MLDLVSSDCGDDYGEYFREKIWRILALGDGHSDAKIVRLIVAGTSDPCTRAKIMSRRPLTVREFGDNILPLLTTPPSPVSVTEEKKKKKRAAAAALPSSRKHATLMFCDFCRRRGHEAAECFVRRHTVRYEAPFCSFCRRMGHEVAECYIRRHTERYDVPFCNLCRRMGYLVAECYVRRDTEITDGGQTGRGEERYCV